MEHKSDMSDMRRRVKVYALNSERQWSDRGTGYVSSSYADHLKDVVLIVRDESDGSLLLESKIKFHTAYNKQQETLIVWTEGDNLELALSFQEKGGCDEIWEKICQIQGKDPSLDYTQEDCEDDASASSPLVLPPCELCYLNEINEIISSRLTNTIWKEKLTLAIKNNDYIAKLLHLFHMCEDLENLEGLHHLYEIFRSIFLLNKSSLFEIMFQEETILSVVGCLEYDPSTSSPKKHRQYLKDLSRFKEIIPITDPEIVAKIHQTYRVQYIQDEVLPMLSLFEDNLLSSLSSFIFLNKAEIVMRIQEDDKFLNELFIHLQDKSISNEKCTDLVHFLKEFYEFSQNLQLSEKELFHKKMYSLGILSALEKILQIEELQIEAASVVIFTCIVEFIPCVVLNHITQQINKVKDDQILLNIMSNRIIHINSTELGTRLQLLSLLKILLDQEMISTITNAQKLDIMSYFYKYTINAFAAPLVSNTKASRPVKDDQYIVQIQAIVLDLLSFCAEHHSYYMKKYIQKTNFLRHVMVLTYSRHTYLVLHALRFFKKIVTMKDEFYTNYIIQGNFFRTVVDVFLRNKGRYNLLDSSILSIFEFLKFENVRSLSSHVMQNYGKVLGKVNHVQTFKDLKLKYDENEQNQEEPSSVSSLCQAQCPHNCQKTKGREWFDEDNDCNKTSKKDTLSAVSSSIFHRSLHSKLIPMNKNVNPGCRKLYVNRSSNVNNVINKATEDLPIDNSKQTKKIMLDYEGDDEDEGEELSPSFKRARV